MQINRIDDGYPNPIMPPRPNPSYPRPISPRIANYNAVKIDIHNPQVNAPQQNERKDGYCTCPVVYDYPKHAVYDVPKTSVYEPKAEAKKIQVPPPVIIQQPAVKEVKEPESVLKNNVTNPIEKENIQAQKAAQEAPKAVEAEAVAPKKVEIEKPEAIKPVIDINKFIDAIKSPNYNIQANAMQDATALIQAAPDMAIDLLDVKVVDTLLNLVNQSNSNLAGPTPRQIEIRDRIMKGQAVSEAELAEANMRTPRELAERNKQYAMYTIAAMDKLYATEVEKLTGAKPPITELPGTADIVEQLKTNPNPMVRIAAIKSLDYIKTPEYKEDLKAIYSIAATDPDEIVQKMAQTAAARLDK